MDNTDSNRWLAVIGVRDPQNRFSNVSSNNDWQAFARPLHASVRRAEGRIAAWRVRARKRWRVLRARWGRFWRDEISEMIGSIGYDQYRRRPVRLANKRQRTESLLRQWEPQSISELRDSFFYWRGNPLRIYNPDHDRMN